MPPYIKNFKSVSFESYKFILNFWELSKNYFYANSSCSKNPCYSRIFCTYIPPSKKGRSMNSEIINALLKAPFLF